MKTPKVDLPPQFRMGNKKVKLEPVRDPVQASVHDPDPNPRGFRFYFTANEWRLLLGFELNGKRPGLPRLETYVGIGPVLFRVCV